MSDDDGLDERKTKAQFRIIRTVFHILNGGSGSSGPSVGAKVGGGGVVTGVSPTTVTVEFPDGVPTGPITLPDSETTVVIEYVAATDGGSTGGGFGPVVGQQVEGGGIVTAVTDSTVTIKFPDGVPPGPITLPGSETTVVIETPVGDPQDISVSAPWGPDDLVTPAVGAESPVGETLKSVDGHLFTRFRLPSPGSRTASVPLTELVNGQPQPMRILFNPQNTSSCPCAVFIGSFDSSGQLLDNVMVVPGAPLPRYEAPPGTASVRAACSAGCQPSGCSCELTISNPIS